MVLNTTPISPTATTSHFLFDAPLAPFAAGSVMPTSALSPELRELGISPTNDPSVEVAILKTLGKRALERLTTLPPIPERIDLYVAMSALQKAIRVGNSTLALAASRWLIEKGFTAALWTRLRTIAVEDVGLGDPEVAAFVVRLAGVKDLRAETGSLAVLICAIDCTVQAVKSRDMTDLAYWSGLPGSIDQLMPIFGHAGAILR